MVGIEEEVKAIFQQHPDVTYDEEGNVFLPISAIPEIIQDQSSAEEGNLLSEDKFHEFMNILEASGKPVGIDPIVQLYAFKSKTATDDDPDSPMRPGSNNSSPQSGPNSRDSHSSNPPPIPPKDASNPTDSPFEAKKSAESTSACGAVRFPPETYPCIPDTSTKSIWLIQF